MLYYSHALPCPINTYTTFVEINGSNPKINGKDNNTNQQPRATTTSGPVSQQLIKSERKESKGTTF